MFVKLFALTFRGSSPGSVFHVLCISTTALLPALYTVSVEYISREALREAAEYEMLGTLHVHMILQRWS